MDDDLSFYSKAERKAIRKARRANMTTDEKMTRFFTNLSKLVCFLCASYGSYAISKEIFRFFGWIDILASILGFLLFIVSVIFIFLIHSPPEPALSKLNDYKIKNHELMQQLEHCQRELHNIESSSSVILPILRAYSRASPEEKAAFLKLADRPRQ